MSDQKWALRAKAQGYPLCSDCQEPLAKECWGQRQCRPCEIGTHRVQKRRRDDEQLALRRRKDGAD